MADESPGGAVTRPFSLVPLPLNRQNRTAQLKAERLKRKSERRVSEALEAEPRVFSGNPCELARAWSSTGLRELRRDLPPHEEEALYNQLAGLLSGEISFEIWHATLCALREARRAAEVPAGVHPRKWRQSFSSSDYW